MGLNITQELEVLEHGETPGTGIGPGTNPLSELIYQSAVGESIGFLGGAGNPDPETQEDAYRYLSKMTSLISKVVRKDATTLDTMRKVLVSLVGDSTFTYSQVSSANEDSWISLIEGGLIPTVNIGIVFEIVAGILPHEKTAYVAL